MKPTTFLSVPWRPWSFSFGMHLAFLLLILFLGRGHTLDLTFIDLDLAPASTLRPPSRQAPADDEWRLPPARPSRIAPPLPKPEVKVPPAPAPPGPAVPEDGRGTGEVHSIAQVSQLPHYLIQVKPQYPDAANRANIEGVVILQVDIDAAGRVKKVDLIQGLGYGCDEAAIAAVQQSTFTPAYAGGEPVPVSIRLPYRFKFDD